MSSRRVGFNEVREAKRRSSAKPDPYYLRDVEGRSWFYCVQPRNITRRAAASIRFKIPQAHGKKSSATTPAHFLIFSILP